MFWGPNENVEPIDPRIRELEGDGRRGMPGMLKRFVGGGVEVIISSFNWGARTKKCSLRVRFRHAHQGRLNGPILNIDRIFPSRLFILRIYPSSLYHAYNSGRSSHSHIHGLLLQRESCLDTRRHTLYTSLSFQDSDARIVAVDDLLAVAHPVSISVCVYSVAAVVSSSSPVLVHRSRRPDT